MPRLLFVDDDEEILDLLTRFFRQHGYGVAAAKDGAAMFAALKHQAFDLIVLDVMLPGEDGLSLCRRLRTTSNVPVIMLTAMGDPSADPLPALGPEKMRQAIEAFNAMQSQIQRFVTGQAAMFAAISHDLRTPLTRMRLRGEFIEDADQQARLFRDVDEMEAMVAAVLAFLRDNAADEETTSLDLAELLRSIADDHADSGHAVVLAGPAHLPFPGRPVGLRRAFGNLVENAVRYGGRARIELRCEGGAVVVTVTDPGPGIPDAALERVFAPFHRLEDSRNRHTGGMGLGLTSARSGFRAHGGDVTLANGPGAGLRATVVLPLAGGSPGRDGMQPCW